MKGDDAVGKHHRLPEREDWEFPTEIALDDDSTPSSCSRRGRVGIRMRPMVEFDALMANPYPLAIPFALLGLVLLGLPCEGHARPRHAGVGCLGMALVCGWRQTWSRLQQNVRCQLSKFGGGGLRGQIEAARRRLHPEAGWAVGDERSPRQGFATLDRQIAQAGRYRFSSWNILQIKGTTLRSDRVKVDLKVRVVDGGRPIASTWQIELRDGTNGWQVTDVLWRTLLGQRPPSRMP